MRNAKTPVVHVEPFRSSPSGVCGKRAITAESPHRYFGGGSQSSAARHHAEEMQRGVFVDFAADAFMPVSRMMLCSDVSCVFEKKVWWVADGNLLCGVL